MSNASSESSDGDEAHTGRDIPAEVYGEIVAHITDPVDLCAFARVSRVANFEAERALYHMITLIAHQKRIETLRAALNTRRRAQLVRGLVVCSDRLEGDPFRGSCQDSSLISSLSSIISTLPGLQELVFKFSPHGEHDICQEVFPKIGRLRKLDYPFHISHNVASFISSQYHLQHLELWTMCENAENLTEILQNASFPFLRILRCPNHIAPALVAASPNLTHLCVGGEVDEEQLPQFISEVVPAASSLLSFRYDGWWLPREALVAIAVYMPQLRHLDGLSFLDEITLPETIEVLCTFRSLRSCVVEDFYQGNSEMECLRNCNVLADALQQFCPSLRSVHWYDNSEYSYRTAERWVTVDREFMDDYWLDVKA